MKRILNLFTKGVVSDVDYSKMDNQSWVFPTKNIRIVSRNNNLVITPLLGNTNVDNTGAVVGNGQEFQLSDGFKPIGYDSHNGIAYIVSYNEVTDQTEIGTYPSPQQYTYIPGSNTFNVNTVLSGFKSVYQPLANYTGSLPSNPREAHRSNLYGYNSENKVDVFVRTTYDNSVNLYICDGETYNRVVNSGFNQDGEMIDTTIYSDADFGSRLNQFLQCNSRPEIIDFELKGGGKLKYGNYIIYFRYVTADFNNTHFIAESGPVQVYDGESTYATISGGDANTISDKLIKFTLSDLDTTYKYLQVSYVRSYGDIEVLKERKVLTKYIEITDVTQDILITGHEAATDIDIGEIIKALPYDQISYTHAQHANRYYGGNWKEVDLNNEALFTFAQKVKLSYDDHTTRMKDIPTQSTTSPDLNYQDYKKTYHNVGYFRTESYPFALVFELQDSNMSPAYPTRGIDALYKDYAAINAAYASNTDTNDKGIIRFPTQVISNGYMNSEIRILGVEVQFDDAMAWLGGGSDPELTAWITANVRKIYVVRGDRYENLRYQGLMISATRAQGNIYSLELTDDCSKNGLVTDSSTLYDGSAINVNGTDFKYGQGRFYPTISHIQSKYLGGQPYGQILSEGKHTKGSKTTHIFTQSFNKQPNAIAKYRKMMMPIFRGYTPMSFWKNQANGTFMNKKDFIINYTSRFFCEPGYYGFYSPDFMFRRINDINDIGWITRVAKTRITRGAYKWKTLSNNETVPDFFSHFNGSLISPVMYYWDVIDNYVYSCPYSPGQTFYKAHAPLVKVEKVGEAQNNTVQNPVSVNKDFINYATDYWENPATTFFYAYRDKGKDKIWSSRSMYTPKYIAIHNNDTYKNPVKADGGNNNLDICNLYNTNPDVIDIENIYEPINTLYSIIGNGITLTQLATKNIVLRYQGDCFLQRTYFKQMSWPGSKFGYDPDLDDWDTVGLDDDQNDNPKENQGVHVLFSHGVTLSIIVESAINTAMRYSGEDNTFYPQKEKYAFSKGAYKDGDMESFLVNLGNSETLSDKKFQHWNSLIPFDPKRKSTRMRYSGKINENSYADVYRNIDEASYQDYELDRGPIRKVLSVGNLFSVQENAINEHTTERNQFKIPSSSGDIAVGFNDVLSPQARKIGNYGVKAREHVIQAGTGFYGVDINRHLMIWRASLQDVGMSYAFVGEPLSERKMVSSWIRDLHDEETLKTDIVSQTEAFDITCGYDEYSREVIFTLKKQAQEETPGMERSLVFTETLDAFLGENDYNSDFYMKINKDFYSFKLTGQQWNSFLHNRQEQYLYLYGQQMEMDLSFIVNGNTKDSLGSLVEKNYLSYEVEAREIPFARAVYSTENQISNVGVWHDETRFWYLPQYLEDHWKAPFAVKTDTTEQEFQPNSSLKGTWLKINLTYDQNDYTFVKSFLTNYIDSNS